VESSCKHSNERFGSINCLQLPEYCTTDAFSRKAHVQEVSLVCGTKGSELVASGLTTILVRYGR
jgi:hypothetical protein